jgi:hypothetical protein
MVLGDVALNFCKIFSVYPVVLLDTPIINDVQCIGHMISQKWVPSEKALLVMAVACTCLVELAVKPLGEI